MNDIQFFDKSKKEKEEERRITSFRSTLLEKIDSASIGLDLWTQFHLLLSSYQKENWMIRSKSLLSCVFSDCD
ncbi:hypothetical protein Q1695_012619 [Nippostrongylus brasiliensis]|nr:hypothetical protein Q1695_012619 [Nippostrongylus brasiliensis]